MPRNKDEAVAARRASRARARDVEIPDIVNLERRESCRFDLIRFMDIYFPRLFKKARGQFQIDRIKRTQDLILEGGNASDAQPRGSGKTTEARIAAIWAVLYGHKKCFVIFCAKQAKASESFDAIKFFLETNDLLLEDFPEVCAPIRALNGISQRGQSQTVDGKRTHIVWRADVVMLPRIEASDASGAIITACGLDSANRGANILGTRPDFVFIDDAETEKTVTSETMTAKIDDTVNKAIGAMGEPGEMISCLWRGTVIVKNCLIDQYTDTDEHPEWDGYKQAIVISWPEREDLWDQYLDMLKEGGKSKQDKTGRCANEFYLANREEMDKGAEVAWPDWYNGKIHKDGKPIESSAIQHAYNMLHRWGKKAFYSEFQNDPISDESDDIEKITPEYIANCLSTYPQYLVPTGYGRLFQGIDIRKTEIHFAVIGASPEGSSVVIDYDILVTGADDLYMEPDGRAIEVRILEALKRHSEAQATKYRNEAGDIIHVEFSLVDSGWMEDIIYRFCKQHPKYRPCKGRGSNQRHGAYVAQSKVMQKSGKKSLHWHIAKQPGGHMLYWLDADHWKLYTHERFLQSNNTPGACRIFGSNPKMHKRFSQQLCAEEYDPEKMRWEKVDKHNHWFDCMSMAHAAADIKGIHIVDHIGDLVMGKSEEEQSAWFTKEERIGRKR